jgi:intein/homing endonuclease
MLYRTKHATGRTLYKSRPLLISPAQAYSRPEPGKAWFATTTTTWRVDEIIKRRVRDWRRLTGETGHDGTRAETMRKDHDSIYTGTSSVFPAPLVEWILLRYGGEPGGRILDAFAGGPPRGLVSTIMGYRYTGVELRREQIDENLAVLEGIGLAGADYICTDGRFLDGVGGPFDAAISCHPADTKITTALGVKPISAVAVDDWVFTHKGTFKPVTEKLTRQYDGILYSFNRDYKDRPLRATAEHPLLTSRRGFIKWARADEVEVGDCLVEPIKHQHQIKFDGSFVFKYAYPTGRGRQKLKGKDKVYATKSIMRLIGYYLAEGNTNSRSVYFAFNANEERYKNEVTRDFRGSFFSKAKLKIARPTTHSIVGYSVTAVQFFGLHCGRGAPNKHFPGWVWGCSDEYLIELLRSLWNGDGWMEINNPSKLGHTRFGYATVSEQLAEDIRHLLIRLGIVPSVRLRAPRTKGLFTDGAYQAFKSTLPQYNLVVRGIYADKLASVLGVKIKHPKTKRRPSRSPQMTKDYVLYPIRSIEKRKVKNLQVFNLEVAHDHSYVADGVCSHNCPPYYDLEQYSDNAADLSNMRTYDEFNYGMFACATAHAKVLKPGAFVCFVVGLFRDKRGELVDFRAHTVKNFRDAGFIFWQDIVLTRNFASAAVRSTNAWRGKKLVPTNEHLLIFRQPEDHVWTDE